MNIPENIFNTLTSEQKKKAAEAKNPQELIALAKECGQELTQEQLESVDAGFGCWGKCDPVCHERECGSNTTCRY
jgi:hypothetical protein